MGKNTVLIHSALAVLLVLYLLVRLFFSLFGIADPEYQQIMRRKFRIPDWIFIGLIAITGFYPIIILGNIELYHVIKIILLGVVTWLTRFNSSLNFAGVTLLIILLVGYSGYASFTDSPKFPKAEGTFERDHPEVATMSRLEKGKFIFRTLCTQCHGNDGTLGRFQAADLTQSKLSLDQKIKMIRKGSPLTVMRSFTNELSPEEIEAVAFYVHQFSQK